MNTAIRRTEDTPRPDQGVLLMAHTRKSFLGQASDMIRSLRRHSPSTPIALVTQWPKDRRAQLADIVIPLTGATVGDCRPKLDLDTYTPFDRTLYLDVDSLTVGNVEPLFRRFAGSSVAVLGERISRGRWYTDVGRLCAMAGTTHVPKFSGGIIYLEKDDVTAGVFAYSRHLADRYADLDLDTFAGGVADEPLLAVALARVGLEAQPVADSSWSLLGLSAPPRLDVLAGTAEFMKHGTSVRPVVVHFASLFSERFSLAGGYYRRERLRLRLQPLGERPAAVCAHIVHGPACAVYGLLLRAHRKRPLRWTAWALNR